MKVNINLPPEELEKLKQRVPISKDDLTALCTKEGWAKYQTEKARVLPTAQAEARKIDEARWKETHPGG